MVVLLVKGKPIIAAIFSVYWNLTNLAMLVFIEYSYEQLPFQIVEKGLVLRPLEYIIIHDIALPVTILIESCLFVCLFRSHVSVNAAQLSLPTKLDNMHHAFALYLMLHALHPTQLHK